MNYLSGNTNQVKNISDSQDTKILQDLLSKAHKEAIFDVGHAGTCMRFLTALFSIIPGERILKGSDRMHQRPIGVLINALRELGAQIEYLEKEGYPPLKINGTHLKGGIVSLSGNISSQYLSALMLIAPYLENGLKIKIENELVSKPYVDMTIKIMQDFGVEVTFLDKTIQIKSGAYNQKEYQVESDWSSASYWYEAVTFCNDAEVEIQGLKYDDSLQADSIIRELFLDFNVETKKTLNGIIVKKGTRKLTLEPTYNFLKCPDIAQTIACTSILNDSEIILTGLKTLRIKETDRILALVTELRKLGILIKEEDENIIVFKSKCISKNNVVIQTYNDHRMAMAFASMVFFLGEISIENPEVTIKSYPSFWKDLASVGVKIQKIEKQ